MDGITEVVQRHVAAGTGGPVAHGPLLLFSNGRSAFSASLAEYVLAAALHFNKRVRARCGFIRV